ncbi:hypothetical protein SAMN04490355_103218 [Pelosinus propionicus DSM 13327]|uniref:Uncharacterized protein n=1 Tax=Pelosinus propionicus DSM 13327 TaxID=1123291 RepID=A0A1I4MC24_9FIRM|nr:hypothetical protein SAMN04490355_103218 [Pelosinus propionicus DSM 13327]
MIIVVGANAVRLARGVDIPIAAGDGAAAGVIADETACVGVGGGNRAGAVGVGDGADVVADKAARDGVVVVGGGGGGGRNRAGAVGVGDGADVAADKAARDGVGVVGGGRNRAGAVGVGDGAAVVVADKAARVGVVGGGGNRAGAVGVGDGAAVVETDKAAHVGGGGGGGGGNRAAPKTDVAQRRAAAGITKQASVNNSVGRRQVDRQSADSMAQAVEGAGERIAVGADGDEAGAAIPGTGTAGVDVNAEDVVAGEVAADILQGLQRAGAAVAAAAIIIDHRVSCAVETKRRSAAGQRDAGAATQAVAAAAAGAGHQRQAGIRAAGCHSGVDIDIAIGRERQRGAARPGDRRRHGDVAGLAAAAAGGDGNIVVGQCALQSGDTDHAVVA